MTSLVSLSELFTINYGNSLELINMEQCKSTNMNAVPFISRTENNNGVSAFVEKEFDIDTNPAHTLTVAVGGSVLATFYQPLPYYTGFHVLVLSPKAKMEILEMIVYAKYIKTNSYQYNFGRQANKTLKNILVPEKISDKLLEKLSSYYQELMSSITIDPQNREKYIGLFIVTVILQDKYRFNYGRKWELERMKESQIILPSVDNEVDADYMENYIKSLRYSGN